MIAVDADGNLVVADSYSATVRRISIDGRVTTLAGSAGSTGSVDGAIAASRFGYPFGVAADSSGNVYVSDSAFDSIRRITTTDTVQTFVGLPFSSSGSVDGPRTVATFNDPRGIAIDANGTLFIADNENHTIRKILADGTTTTLAGIAGISGYADGTGAGARFNSPNGVAVATDGSLYVADTANSTIRKIASDGKVTTFAGTAGQTGSTDGVGASARFSSPYGIAIDSKNVLYVTDTNNSTIRKITPDGTVTTIGGTAGVSGHAEGTGRSAQFDIPMGIAVDANGVLYIVDAFSSVIMRGSLDTTPRITSQPQATTARPGSSVTLSVTATGGGLGYQWEYNGSAISGATGSSYTLTNVQTSQAGAYRVTISNTAGATTSSSATLTVSNTSTLGRISNLAIRSKAGTAAQTLIVGFSIGGKDTTGNKPLLIRGVGPTLSTYSVPGFLNDPKLELYGPAGKLTENDDWAGETQVSTVGTRLGAFPLMNASSKDAALYSNSLNNGTYSVQLSGKAGSTGVALAEIYDATPSDTFLTSTPRLTNVSARTQVGTNSDILIAGFVISGETAKNILIRGIGPTLSGFGVADSLADPKLELFNSASVRIDGNDDWGGRTELINAFNSVGAFQLKSDSKDAALVVTLTPGLYTVQISGVGGTTGVALVEIYELP